MGIKERLHPPNLAVVSGEQDRGSYPCIRSRLFVMGSRSISNGSCASPSSGELSGVSSNGGATPVASSVSPSASPTWLGDLYAATTVAEGMRIFARVVPLWVPVTGAISAAGLYYLSFRARLFIAKWRVAARRRAELKYELLDNLRGVSMAPVGAGAVEPLGDDDGDDEEEEEDDETAVSMRDIDEFRSSLGIRLPRDEDLLVIVERMLMVDPITDGWVLYRTTAGIIRFMNLNTQELFFFHPGKKRERAHIEAELQKRNRQAMESKYSFSYEDEGMNSFSIWRPLHSSSTSHMVMSSGPQPIDFGTDDGTLAHEDAMQNSTFMRMFNYFLDREQRKIEKDVLRSRHHNGSGDGSGGPHASSTNWDGQSSPTTTVSQATNVERSSALGHRARDSMTYRVVPSSTIYGSRGASVN